MESQETGEKGTFRYRDLTDAKRDCNGTRPACLDGALHHSARLCESTSAAIWCRSDSVLTDGG